MCALDKKAISIGTEDFKEIIDKNGYLVDKTLMIRDLLDSNVKAALFTRPRRFGKTLNLSMLRRFFEDERKQDGTPVDNRYLFDGLAISQCGEEYLRHQQQYPVINLSLKSAKQPTYLAAFTELKKRIAEEYRRHEYILEDPAFGEMERDQYALLMDWRSDDLLFSDALGFLSACLAKHHGKKCIILIDEYDVPLENAWFAGFYDEMIGFVRSLFESALKTNDSLEFGVITGCLRISRESIFTGLNNLDINSVLGPAFTDSFGFTEEEVKEMLCYYSLTNKFAELKAWYDGYQFGKKEIYNPWSIVRYVKTADCDPDFPPRPYWSNTSSNSIIRDLVENADQKIRDEIERLIAGEALEKPIREEITYGDIHESDDNLWNFLYFTGYLTSAGKIFRNEKTYVKMVIPNAEVKTIYKDTVLRWFDKKLARRDLKPLIKAIEEGNCEAMGDIISGELMDTISFFDYGESYYHGFLAGLLRTAGGYRIESNRESGEGRTDLILKTPMIRNGRAVILGLKAAKAFGDMEALCKAALAQIEEKKYEEGLRQEGYQDIAKYGICFFRKECLVMQEKGAAQLTAGA